MIYTCGKEKNSDCFVAIQLGQSENIVEVQSKMKQLFGRHIENAVKEVLVDFNINNAKVLVKDFGALDFVVKARTKTALREAIKGGQA